MNKKFFNLLFIAFIALISVSCSKDDNNDNNPLIGTWRKIYVNSSGYETNYSLEGEGVNWVFNADGTMYEHDIDADGNIISSRTEKFYYKTENGHLITAEVERDGRVDDWKDEGAYSISNDILQITEDDGNYIKKYKKIN